MRRSSHVLFVVACAVVLCGCAAKPVTPVQMAQPGDEQLSCAELNQQIQVNEAAAKDFLKKDKQVENGNAAKTVMSATPFIGILSAMAVDLSNVEQIKARAILDRNERLTYLKKQKGCSQ
jgi:hypothetical protein